MFRETILQGMITPLYWTAVGAFSILGSNGKQYHGIDVPGFEDEYFMY